MQVLWNRANSDNAQQVGLLFCAVFFSAVGYGNLSCPICRDVGRNSCFIYLLFACLFFTDLQMQSVQKNVGTSIFFY